MKEKTLRIIYWAVTGLFSLFFIVDGIVKLMQVDQAKEIMAHLGYPLYILPILGIANILGVIGILQTKYGILKEWAYAGFTFHFLGASMSRVFVGDNIALVFSPLMFLAAMFVSYFFWKEVERRRR